MVDRMIVEIELKYYEIIERHYSELYRKWFMKAERGIC